MIIDGKSIKIENRYHFNSKSRIVNMNFFYQNIERCIYDQNNGDIFISLW